MLNDKAFSDWRSLNDYMIGIVGNERGPGSYQETAEVELDCDYSLRYEHVISAVTAVSGFVDDGGNVVKLVEKIKFSPPRPASG
jgi:biopolymer transport protein ExbD